MQYKLYFDVSYPVKKGQKFHFSWASINGRTNGFAIAVETFKKVVFSKEEVKEIDTEPGIHYIGLALAHYK